MEEGLYHNQALIDSRIEDLSKLSISERSEVKSDLLIFKEEAEYEVNKINDYTAPEEIERRKQSLYYYKDLLKGIEGIEDL